MLDRVRLTDAQTEVYERWQECRAHIEIELTLDREASAIRCTGTAATHGPTGVEIEALTAVQIALLTVYDMCKAVDRGMVIADVRLVSKAGGRSDNWVADAETP